MNYPPSSFGHLSDDELKSLHWVHTERYTRYQQEINRIIATPYNPLETDEETARMDIYMANVMKQMKRNGTRAFNVHRQILYRDSQAFQARMSDLKPRQTQ